MEKKYEENAIVWVKASKLQPSQFCINEEKLNALTKEFNMDLFEPVPIKKMGQDTVMMDGHTRTCYLIQQGFKKIPTVEEPSVLNWDAYTINVRDCKEKGIRSALDLVNCIVPSEIFQQNWDKYCDSVQEQVALRLNLQ